MNNFYFNLLDRNNRLLVQEIEEIIGSEIEIKVDVARINKLGCEVDKDGATILLPKEDYFPNSSAYHELLHIRRFCVHKIPRILACENFNGWNSKLSSALISLDNDIEHFIIVPEEIKQYKMRNSYWENKVENILVNYDSLGLIKDDQERRVLINWAFVHHVFSCKELIDKANTAINNLCIVDRTYQFIEEVVQALDKKEILTQVFFKHLKIPIDAGSLEYLDCINNTSYEIQLKEVQQNQYSRSLRSG